MKNVVKIIKLKIRLQIKYIKRLNNYRNIRLLQY